MSRIRTARTLENTTLVVIIQSESIALIEPNELVADNKCSGLEQSKIDQAGL